MNQSALVSSAADPQLVEYDVERRVQLTFAVSSEKIATFLPQSWQPATMPPGPAEGANLIVTFRNRLLTTHYDADGKAHAGEQDCGVVVLVAGKNAATGEFGLRVVRSYAANSGSAPGPYKNSKHVSIRMEQSLVTDGASGGSGLESWQLRDDTGQGMKLLLRYEAGVPVQNITEMKMYGGPDPAFFRIYRTDKGADVVISAPKNIHRAEEFLFENTFAEFTDILDGSEKLVSAAIEPWYLRDVLLPAAATE